MIVFLQGVLAEKDPTRVVIDCGGVGHEVFIPLSTYDRLPRKGETCRILTHDHVRDDAHRLFGFMTEAERAMFEMLMDVSGIGPKLALSALSGLSVRDLKAAVVAGDVKRLSSISGVGKKLAERIALELRHRLSESDALEAMAGVEPGAPEDARLRDAVMALVSLGYKQAEARTMVRDAAGGARAGEMTVEDIIRKALSR
jgi:Holliday junction DNA helicase RuvA